MCRQTDTQRGANKATVFIVRLFVLQLIKRRTNHTQTSVTRKENDVMTAKIVASVYEFTGMVHLQPCNKTKLSSHCDALYGCATWYLLSWEEYRLSVLESRAIRTILRSEWKK